MRLALLGLLAVSSAAAQGIGAGVKGGIPFGGAFTFALPGYQAGTQRFTIGPMLDVRLPLGLGVEFDALYKRLDQTGPAIGGGAVSKPGSSWEFPLLGKYRVRRSPATPYVEAGVSFQRLGGYLVPFRTLPSAPAEEPVQSTTRAGVAAGAGIELRFSALRISPGLRFSRWGGRLFVRSENALDLLVGVTF